MHTFEYVNFSQVYMWPSYPPHFISSICLVQVKGGGANRRVTLHPRCVFAMDIAQLSTAHPEGLLVSKVVPAYKEMFGRELNVTTVGFPKLLRALESIQDIIEVRFIFVLLVEVYTCWMYCVYTCTCTTCRSLAQEQAEKYCQGEELLPVRLFYMYMCLSNTKHVFSLARSIWAPAKRCDGASYYGSYSVLRFVNRDCAEPSLYGSREILFAGSRDAYEYHYTSAYAGVHGEWPPYRAI